jgi:hypothetical protein
VIRVAVLNAAVCMSTGLEPGTAGSVLSERWLIAAASRLADNSTSQERNHLAG